MARRRPSLGRQRIEIQRIESKQVRQVCFSKRRAGLFKKASELAIMCGAEVAAVVFSPTGNTFSFGHPSVEAIIERFDPTGPLLAGAAGGEDRKQLVELNRRYAELSARVDAEKARKERAEAAMSKERAKGNRPVAKWLQANVRDLGEEELKAYAGALMEVEAAVAARANQVLQDARNHGQAMEAMARARSSNINYQMQAPPQQFLLANNGAARFVDQFGAGSAYNNGAEVDMQIQEMMMAMAMSPPGFVGAGMEMLLQQGFGGFPGPY